MGWCPDDFPPDVRLDGPDLDLLALGVGFWRLSAGIDPRNNPVVALSRAGNDVADLRQFTLGSFLQFMHHTTTLWPIRESGLRDKDIIVLTLYRGTVVIPNPRPHRQLQSGDRLLCFGKLELMRDLIPGKIRRKRRPTVKNLPDLPVAEEALKEYEKSVSDIVLPEEEGNGLE